LPDNGVKAMITLSQLRTEKKAEILRLARLHGCRNMRIFGSVTAGESGPESDVDILVDLDPGRGLLDLGTLLTELTGLLHAEVDLVESGSLHPYVRDRVLAEAVPL
jgi:predicted nucleotidyltransferase